jgi:hydroxymethylbilane synthase
MTVSGAQGPPTVLRIGTRGSRLALAQSTWVAQQLRALGHAVELTSIQTTGDRLRDAALIALGGTGAFTKEIQRALLDETVDVGVHSLKDLPTARVPGLVLAAIPLRLPAGDALISHRHESFDALPAGAKIGTSSIRRRAQILFRRPDLTVFELRGNVETRISRLEQGPLDAIVLARAGLLRLKLGHLVAQDLDWMLPAVGQGALGLECRQTDARTIARVTSLNDRPSCDSALAERAFLAALGGGCLVPIGASCKIDNDKLVLLGGVYSPDGKRAVSGSRTGATTQGEALGRELADELLQRGGRELLASSW